MAAALAFPFRNPAVRSVLIGTASTSELAECLTMTHAAIPEMLWADLAAVEALPA
jgi:aryl-alcohol dehydrogenase-like predicted oxidoreductase